jgi:transglutaminase-like putative cysteine protease
MSDTNAMTLQIRHTTGFTYAGRAVSSYNEARMSPVSLPRQNVLEASIRTKPNALQSTYRDYFGTIVTTFDIHDRHDRLEVVSDALVETMEEETTAAPFEVAALRTPDAADRFAEYLAPTIRTSLSDDVVDEFQTMVANEQRVSSVGAAVLELVRGRVSYVKGATVVSSTAQEVWEQQQGVCQDLTHVTIALLRSVGVPARYVSGYLHSNDEAGIGEKVVGESHAWVEYFDGGWVGIDPTNGGGIGLHHVVVAKGREYGDVPPLKGIYHGDPSSALGVVVEITRVA